MPTTARFFAGIAFTQERDGVVVESALPRGPGAKAGLKAGDRMLAVGQQPVASAAEFVAVLRRTNALSLQRGSRTRKAKLTAVDLLGPGLKAFAEIIEGPAVTGKRCDSNCNCTIPQANSICRTWYKVKGAGPRGGVLLEKHCTWSSFADGPQGGETACGTKEYF